jgi:hypothetical protein
MSLRLNLRYSAEGAGETTRNPNHGSQYRGLN